jgi:hypothetical protein
VIFLVLEKFLKNQGQIVPLAILPAPPLALP